MLTRRNIGGIEKRGHNKFRLTVNKGYDSEGNKLRYRKTVIAEDEREAEKQLALFISEVEKGLFIKDTGLTVEKLADLFKKQYCEKNLAPRTFFSYSYQLEKYIIPSIGKIKLKDLKPLHLVNLYNKLLSNGIRSDGKKGSLSARTVRYNHSIISCMLNHAVRWEIISSNPAKKVSPPRQHRQEARYYNEEQVKELLNALRTAPYKYYVAVVLALATGLRRGEIIALEWNDIDFDNKTINVNKSSQYISKKGMVTGGPKTESSIRVISIPDEVVNILKKYRTLQDDTKEKLGNIWVESNRLFTQKHGEPMYADTLSSWFRKFIQKNCLDDLNFHGLRHTSATILSSMGIDIPTISKRLGHSKPSTTSDIYAHALRSIDRKASIVIEDVLSLENYKIDGNTLNV